MTRSALSIWIYLFSKKSQTEINLPNLVIATVPTIQRTNSVLLIRKYYLQPARSYTQIVTRIVLNIALCTGNMYKRSKEVY